MYITAQRYTCSVSDLYSKFLLVLQLGKSLEVIPSPCAEAATEGIL